MGARPQATCLYGKRPEQHPASIPSPTPPGFTKSHPATGQRSRRRRLFSTATQSKKTTLKSSLAGSGLRHSSSEIRLGFSSGATEGKNHKPRYPLGFPREAEFFVRLFFRDRLLDLSGRKDANFLCRSAHFVSNQKNKKERNCSCLPYGRQVVTNLNFAEVHVYNFFKICDILK